MVAPIVVTVDQKGMPIAPIDPNVTLPSRVVANASRADELHRQAYKTSPQPDPAPAPVSPQPVPAPVTVPVTPAPAPQPSPQPAPTDPRASWGANEWMQHAKSMEGRFRQANEQVMTLQGTVSQLGDELVHTQSRVTTPQPQPHVPVTPAPTPLLTPQDVETYGEDFLNVAQRAALQAVEPKLNQLEAQNNQLRQQLRKSAIQSVESVLDANVPNWLQINLSPKFIQWLKQRDIYSGRLRSALLKEAHQAADAARVLNFFKGFLAEEEATGSTEFLPSSQPSPLATPHTPAIELSSLAAPGHARPAQGSSPASATDPQWITRGQIAEFFANVRKGVYRGRDQDYHNDQAFIFECQRAGRVR